MADLRGKIAAISTEANRATEDCVSFYRKETEYAEWLKRHGENGYVLHRDSTASKTSELHISNCPVIGGDEENVKYTATPKIGCPTKPAAMAYARMKKWKVAQTCDKCAVSAV